MQSHQITITEVQKWKSEKKILFASQAGSINKKLYYRCDDVWTVENNHKEVFSGGIEEAVKAYNAI